MTVDLDMMMDLRDVQVALDVARRAEMGWFDVEFTMYGCAYSAQGERFYRVSAYEEKIYDFLAQGAPLGVIPSDICVLSRKYPVPAGMREYIALEVKKDLAREMANDFPAEFFAMLVDLAASVTEETALPLIWQAQEQAEDSFDWRKLRRFGELVDYAYNCRKITPKDYETLGAWLDEEYKNMEEASVVKDIFEKTFYAIAYWQGGNLRYLVNARRGHIAQKKDQLEMQGLFVSPVYAETYCYNYVVRLPQVRSQFETTMRKALSAENLRVLAKIFAHNSKMTAQTFAEHLQACQKNFGPKAAQTLRHYGYRWGIY